MRRGLLCGMVFLAFLLRFVGITSYPVGFNADEASWGFDAYSLLKTGRDQWGSALPVTFQSFGDFKLPVYGYLTVPSIAIFGLNEFATRLPSVLVGTLAVLATYLLAGEMFKNPKLKIVASLLLAVSPWHISLSRAAVEANLTVFFLPFGIWAFLKGLRSPRWMMMAALSLGINVFTYHSARVITPILVCFLWCWKQKEFRFPKFKWSVFIFAAFLLFAFYTTLSGAGARGVDLAIFNPTDKWLAVGQKRFEAVGMGLPDPVARIFSNKVTYTVSILFQNYITYLSPEFLFVSGAGSESYGMISGRGVLYWIELPFLLIALWAVARGGLTNKSSINFILLWILLAPIPAALTKGSGFAANRAAIMMPAIQIFSAYGGIILYDVLSKRWKHYRHILPYCLLVPLFIFLVFFIEDYTFNAPVHTATSMQYGMSEAISYINSEKDKYDQIIFSRSLSEPQIFVAFYSVSASERSEYEKWDPVDYQKESRDWLRYSDQGLMFLDQLGEYHLGKYVFTSIDYQRYSDLSVLFVAKPPEVPKDEKVVKTINYPGGVPAIVFAEPSKQR